MKVTKKDVQITVDQAFRTMVLFLEKYYKATNSDDVRGLCSDLLIMADGGTADPAAGIEWLECLEKAIKNENAGRYMLDLS